MVADSGGVVATVPLYAASQAVAPSAKVVHVVSASASQELRFWLKRAAFCKTIQTRHEVSSATSRETEDEGLLTKY